MFLDHVIPHFCRSLRLVEGWIEGLELIDGRFLGQDPFPECLLPDTDRCDRSDSSDDDAFQSVSRVACVSETEPILAWLLRTKREVHALLKEWGRGIRAFKHWL